MFLIVIYDRSIGTIVLTYIEQYHILIKVVVAMVLCPSAEDPVFDSGRVNLGMLLLIDLL